jgi:PAS domain S-box-containing protein
MLVMEVTFSSRWELGLVFLSGFGECRMSIAHRSARARRDQRLAKSLDRGAATAERTFASAGVWRTAVDSLATNMAVLDERGVILAANAGWSEFATANGGDPALLGVGASYFAACEDALLVEPMAAECLLALREMAAGDRDYFVVEYRCDSPTQQRWVCMRATLFRGGGPARIVVMHIDITERRGEEEQGRRRDSVFEQLDAAVLASDVDGRITEWNDAAERLYGWSRAEVLHQRVRDRLIPSSQHAGLDERWSAMESVGRWEGEFTAQRRDGSTFETHCRTVAIHDAEGKREGYVSVVTDITERLTIERQQLDAADYLQAITNSLGDGMFALDSDGKVTFVNDTATSMLGWPREKFEGAVMHELIHYRHADGTLYAAEDCPITRCRNEDRSVRVTDDVFIRYDGSDLAVAYTAAPFHTEDGVAGSVVVFRDASEERAREQRLSEEVDDLKAAGQVREALDNGTLELFAQPIVQIEGRAVHSEELLLRMRNDDEWIAPGAFLPAAERHGLMPQIDRWVLADAIRLAQAGRRVALNLSSQAFTDFELLGKIEHDINAAVIDPAFLTFEVTETSIVHDQDAASRFLARLRELGCRIALDDFGTGYSGFTYLKHLPVDYLKIDIEFVRDLARSDSSHHVVEAVVSLARNFGYKTIAEGVEDDETLRVLASLGVDYAQGYLLGKPHPARNTTTQSIKEPARHD